MTGLLPGPSPDGFGVGGQDPGPDFSGGSGRPVSSAGSSRPERPPPTYASFPFRKVAPIVPFVYPRPRVASHGTDRNWHGLRHEPIDAPMVVKAFWAGIFGRFDGCC
jgi:hypothetical protein